MNIQQRYKQAAREARWALGLSILYLIGWIICAYLPDGSPGPLGFPLWFELSCVYLPILFVVLAYWLIRIIYQDISLEIDDELKTKSSKNSEKFDRASAENH